jgi:hypothetical protein
MMNVYLEPPVVQSRSLWRVSEALRANLPVEWSIAPNPESADLVVLHVIGRWGQTLRQAERLREYGKRIAILQYCIRSTQKNKTADWLPLWRQATCVWSYYDLAAWADEEGTRLSGTRILHQPLGVDGRVFRCLTPQSKDFLAMTTGFSWLTESVREVVVAAREVGGQRVVHLGPSLGQRAPDVPCFEHIPDDELAKLYRRCHYVSGLRRIEGFELPAAEGLLCGARPIVFDQPHYRHWYGTWAEYIPETCRQDHVDALIALFKKPVRPLTNLELAAAAHRFSWPTLCQRFWEACQ